MKTSLRSRVSAFVMALVMVFSLIPATAFAATSATWTKVELADIAESDTVMITMTNPSGVTYALDASATQKNPAIVVTVDGSTITTPGTDAYGWTIKSAEGGCYIMKGSSYLFTTNTNNGMNVGATAAVWTLDGNYLKSTDDANNARWLGVYDNNNGDYAAVTSPNWRAYKNTSGNTKNQTVGFWKLTDATTPGGGEEPAPAIVPIATALAGADGTEFTVKGVVTLLDGKNVYLQDATGGICVRMSANFTDLALGDTVIGTGKKSVYNGLTQLGSGTYEKSSGMTLTAKETTIGALTTADIATYIALKGVEVTEVYDNNGAYSTPNITVTDGTKSIQIYKAVVGKTDGAWDVQVGDKLDVKAAVSVYNTTLQLRNTLASEITKSAPAPAYDPIATAVAGADGETFTVKGVVTLLDGSNIYLQDATGGICLRVSSKPTDLALGDTVIGSGKKSVYNGLPQLGSGTYEKSSGMTLTAKETTIGALTTPDIATYIALKGVEVTEVYDNNGAYSTPNITVTDGTNSIQLYKAVVGKTDGAWDVKVGDKLDVKAAVGVYKTTLQLRNTLASEITKVVEPEAVVPDGEYVIWAPAYNKALSSTKTGYYNVGVDVTLTDDVLAGYGATEIWTVKNNDDGSITISQNGQKLSMAASNSSMTMDAVNDTWTLVDLGDGLFNVKNDGRGNFIEWYNKYSNWSTYNSSSAATDGQFQLQFYAIPEEEDSLVPDGEYVIWAPAYNKALSSAKTGYYNVGVDVTLTDDVLAGYGATEIWTVKNNDDGSITISQNGQKLSMAASNSSMTMDAVNDTWTLVDLGDGLFNVKNDGRGNFIEWYNKYSNWSTYNSSSAATDGQFQLRFTPAETVTTGGLPAEGDEVVIYNVNAEGVLAAENDTQSINNVAAQIVDDKAIPGNGGVVFTVSRNGEYYRFCNETHGYLCSNGTGNNAFYTKEASEDADWKLETLGKGFKMLSRTAKYNGTSAQYLEYYADSYKTYSFYATNKDGSAADTTIYEFRFYGVADDVALTEGIVNQPAVNFGTLADATFGADYTFSFTVDAVFGVDGALEVKVNGEYVAMNDDGEYVVPAEKVTGERLTITVTGKDTKGAAISGTAEVAVKDEPAIGAVTPAAGSQTLSDKRPVISAEITNAKEGATITMTVNGEAVEATFADGVLTYTPAADMADGRTGVTVTVVRADGKEASKSWSFTVGKAQYELYFGQLHSHTTYSDGSGSLESALEYIKNLPDSANVDFVAFTDHSNYFDVSGAANPEAALYDMSLATAASQKLWSEYKGAIADFNASQSDVVAIGGFEMTWSGGPGHINTFNTPGIVSRNNTTLNNKTSDAGMKAYYALLSQSEGADSLSQFNHPGSTFGTFTDFAYWDAVVDSRIQMVEVGNGEGQVGAGGYYPSYEYYTMALDKGWHVAPTNNQDNHKGKWGNANDARDVILTDDFSEEGIYQALREMRMYSTEDKNLEIGYTVNGLLLGSSITEVPEKLNIDVTVYDPDRADSISKVEVIVNSGKVAYTWDDPAVLATGSLSVTLDPTYSYYYIRVTEGDGDLAVTAPVWVGESLKLGISNVECATSTPVTDEELTLTTTLFNSESANATIESLTYAIKGGKVIGTDTTGYALNAGSTLPVTFKYTPTDARVMTVTVTAVVELEGEEYTFTMDIELDVQDADKLVYIGIDASHYNEYVNGNYKDSMGNFSQLAAGYNVRTVTLQESSDLIAACANDKYKALILTAPSRRSAEAQAASPLKVYTEAELAAIDAFNKAGGIVILAGWSDHYENYPDVASIQNMQPAEHMAATQNAVLEALGSSLRIGDDATYDDTYNGGQAYRLYFNTYGDSFLTEGVEVDDEHPHDRLYTEVFSHYGGASVYTVDGTLPESVTPVVFGHSGTYSVDVDKDGLGGDSMYKYAYAEGDDRLMIMATEQLQGRGLIIVSGAAFMSNFEVQATIEDSGSEKNYANYKVCENLLAVVNPTTITGIAGVQNQTQVGYKYTIEGIVTSNASGYDKNTAFFDCIYVQDETGGVCCFPVAGNYKVGDKVRVTGTTEFYQGEMELQVSSIEKIGEGFDVVPKEVSAKDINDGSVLGQLITVKGHVDSFEKANGLVQTIMVRDEKGDLVRVFIDGYITTAASTFARRAAAGDVENLAVGATITVTGIASYDNTFNAPEGPFPRIRVRDRADVVCGDVDPDYKAPETGDTFRPALWLSMMALTTAAGAVMLLRRKEQQ